MPASSDSPNRASEAKRWLPHIVAGVGGSVAVLGVIAGLVNTANGGSLTAGDIAYYMGVAAWGAYIGSFASMLGALPLQNMAERLNKSWDNQITVLILVIIGVAILVTLYVSPPPDQSTNPTLLRVVGLVTVVGACIYFYSSIRGSGEGVKA